MNDKSYGEMTYTGIKGDRPVLVGLKELPVFVHYEYRKGNAMGGTTEALKEGFTLSRVCWKEGRSCCCRQ